MARSAEVTDGVAVPDQWYPEWVAQNVPDMSGRVVVITGSNSGTGFWCANALASKGATVVLACRTVSKAEAAKKEILGRFPSAKLDVIRMDGMDFASVHEFAKTFNERYSKLDLLVNNAGIMAQPEQQSKDGFDVQLQTNHLSHFLLTQLLWPKLLVAGQSGHQARVINHSSGAHWLGGPAFDRKALSTPPTSCGWCCVWAMFPCLGMGDAAAWKRYGMSKLCNVLFGLELQRRIEKAGLQDSIASMMCHPGYASTQLQKVAGDAGSMKNWKDANSRSAQSAADGSLPLLMACVSSEMQGGLYCGPGGKNEMTGPPKILQTGGNSRNETMAKDLWSFSEEACKAPFNLKA